MDGAALFALFAAVGFGWQPMPDGSERYEYIVQVDQDLAATLAAGKSIPIVGEVPEGIHPIGRVRIVVGEGSLPRERLVTQLKPVVVASADGSAKEQSIVVRGQNAVTPTQYNQYVTPAAQPPAAAQPLVDAANSAANAAANAWNGSAAAPSSSQLFESASSAAQQAWNDNVAAPATDALNNAGQNLSNQLNSSIQQGINSASAQVQQQAQQGWNNAAQSVQSSASSLGDRTKTLINEAAQPHAQQPAATGRSVRQQQAAAPLAVPPPATGSAANPYVGAAPPATNANSWNQVSPPATNPLRPDVPAASPTGTAANEWNGQPTTPFPSQQPLAQPTLGNNGNFAGSQPPALQQPAPQPTAATSGGMNDWNGAGSNTPPGTPPLAAPTNASNGLANGGFGGNDPWAGVPDPRTPAATAGTTPTSTAPGGDLASQPVTPFRGGALGDPGISPPNIAVPGIDRNMLSQSPSRPLDGMAGAPSGLGAVPATNAATALTSAGPTSNGNQQPPKTTPDIFANRQNAPTNPLANQPQTNQANNVAATGAASSDGDNAVVTLVAWVLLFGSVFGNLYLFWSYLDVRQKYRALVRKTARAVGSRFSAA